MEKREISLDESIKNIVGKFIDYSAEKEIVVVSHFDTDGITSAAIMAKTLKRLDKRFSVKIVKSLSPEIINKLPKDKIILFLDLASGSLSHIQEANLEKVFIIDHHELPIESETLADEIEMINPQLNGKEKISSAGLVYLFCKEIDSSNIDLAKLAVLGMIGDLMDKEIENLDNGNLLSEADITKRSGLMIYPATRPLNRALEYCSQPYIPGVTGNSEGAIELLRESGIEPINKRYKNLIELTEEEMKKLVTGIMLRNPKAHRDITGDIFLIKFFNKMEDARELSARVNACSRLGQSDIALRFCMEISNAKKEAEEIHAKYKQHIISGLQFASEAEKISGKGFVILNAEQNIKDTVIGTIASILSNSLSYDEGTVIIALAHYEDKIKVSARSVGNTGRNVRKVLDSVVREIGGEVGGHEFAAGCNISIEHEKRFIDLIKKNFEVELIKV